MSEVAVGLDLGTTISVAAALGASGKIRIAKDQAGRPLIPSVVHFGKRPIVGHDALGAAENSIGNLAEGFKRDIGRPFYRKKVCNRDVPPEVLTAFLVQHLAENVRRDVGAFSDLVVTVPAYFDERQRTSTQRAVALAGLNVIDIINEPTAAAIAAAYELLKSKQTQSVRKLLVYDLGGGTFDATLLEIDGRAFKTLATDGDIYLGGRDFDERVVAMLAESFVKRHGVDPRSDPSDLNLLSSYAVSIKHQLSQKESVSASFEHAGLTDEMTITRSAFEDATAPLVERTLMTCEAVLSDASSSWDDLDQVLLVGGSSRIPLVQKRMNEVAKKPVQLSKNPDLLIAQGAALYAAIRSNRELLDKDSQFDVVNVNAHSLGIQGVDLQTKQRVNKIIIPRNTPLPTSSTEVFSTSKPDQRNVSVRLLEGESENPAFCSPLGKCVVFLDQSLPQGTSVRVHCSYDASGNITVSADVPATKDAAKVELRREGFAELEPLKVWQSRLCGGESESAEQESDPPEMELGPESEINQLIASLDQLYDFVGRKVLLHGSPPGLSMSQLATKSKREADTLKHVLRQLLARQKEQTGSDRMRSEAQLAQLRMAWNQSNKLYMHSCVALGREFLSRPDGPRLFPTLHDKVARLEGWISDRLSPDDSTT